MHQPQRDTSEGRRAITNQRSIFDVIGPVMIGPSSSHTAGAVRLGALARAIFGEQPAEAVIELHGSFASTGPGHGTDLALVAGLLGMALDDARIREADVFARAAGVRVEFAEADLGEVHPNTARMTLRSAEGRGLVVQGSSVGGADVVVTEIDGFPVAISGELPVLIVAHMDRPGMVAGVSAALASGGANIASMEVSREMRGAKALMVIETDQPVEGAALEAVRALENVTAVRVVPAV